MHEGIDYKFRVRCGQHRTHRNANDNNVTYILDIQKMNRLEK